MQSHLDNVRSAVSNVFKRNSPGPAPKPVHQDDSVNRRFARGVDINLKVLLRGDSNTGKTSLLRRLRGGTFIAEYDPSEEITTANVAWTSRDNPGDKVKLEVWDVVDKAPPRKMTDSLNMEHRGADSTDLKPRDVAEAKAARQKQKTSTYMSEKERHRTKQAQHSIQPLDAQAVDVYRGADAVVFMVDPSKRWTYDYVKRKMEEVPDRMPVAIVLNFRDMPASQRQVRTDEVSTECEMTWGTRKPVPCAIDASMLNCYGLSELYSFLHFPYLFKKRAALEQAIKLNSSNLTTLQTMMQEQTTKRDAAHYNAFVGDLLRQGLIREPSKASEGDDGDGPPPHLVDPGATGFGGGPPPPPPTKLQQAGEAAMGAGAAVASGLLTAGTKLYETATKKKEGDATSPETVKPPPGPRGAPAASSYVASGAPKASTSARYGSETAPAGHKGYLPEPSGKETLSRYEEYESRKRLQHLDHKGGVQANALGGVKLPEDGPESPSPRVADSFFAEEDGAAKAKQEAASSGLGGWLKSKVKSVTGAKDSPPPGTPPQPPPPQQRTSEDGGRHSSARAHSLDLGPASSVEEETWGQESDESDEEDRPTMLMNDVGDSASSEDEREKPAQSSRSRQALLPTSMQEAASILSVTDLATEEETQHFFANSPKPSSSSSKKPSSKSAKPLMVEDWDLSPRQKEKESKSKEKKSKSKKSKKDAKDKESSSSSKKSKSKKKEEAKPEPEPESESEEDFY